jgi:hypothetical protein
MENFDSENRKNPTQNDVINTFCSIHTNAEQANVEATLEDIEADLKKELATTTNSAKRKAIETDLKRIAILIKQQQIVDLEMKKATSPKYTFGRDEDEKEVDSEALENAKSDLEAQMIIDETKKKKKRKKKEKEELQEFNDLPDEFKELEVKTDSGKLKNDAKARGRGGHERQPRTR